MKNNSLIYKICQEPEKIPQQVVDKSPSPKYAAQFASSRLALHGCLMDLNGEHNWPDWQELQVDSHLHLKGQPEICVSLAHTRGYGAAVVGTTPPFFSVGIDIEEKSREIKSGVERFFLNPEDLFQNELLKLWSIKEACFKALDPVLKTLEPDFQKQLVLKDFIVGKDSFRLKGRRTTGFWELKEEGDHLIALAWL